MIEKNVEKLCSTLMNCISQESTPVNFRGGYPRVTKQVYKARKGLRGIYSTSIYQCKCTGKKVSANDAINDEDKVDGEDEVDEEDEIQEVDEDYESDED
nr:hypothetical protein [Tanacetum cinerariifolium]